MLNLLNRLLWLPLVTTMPVLAQSDRLPLPYGVTRAGAVLKSEVHSSLLDVDSPLTRILVIAGQDTDANGAGSTATLLRSIADVSVMWSVQFPQVSVSVITVPYPEAPGVTAKF